MPAILNPVIYVYFAFGVTYLAFVRWRSTLLWRTFFTTTTVASVLRAFFECCWSGKCGLFVNGGLIVYDVSSTQTTDGAIDVLGVVLRGIIGGIFSSLYNYLVDKVLRIYSIINEKGPGYKILLVVLVCLLLTCCSFSLLWLGECTPCPTETSKICPSIGEPSRYEQFQCHRATTTISLHSSSTQTMMLFVT